jgi:hypothetical protein
VIVHGLATTLERPIRLISDSFQHGSNTREKKLPEPTGHLISASYKRILDVELELSTPQIYVLPLGPAVHFSRTCNVERPDIDKTNFEVILSLIS